MMGGEWIDLGMTEGGIGDSTKKKQTKGWWLLISVIVVVGINMANG